MPEFNTLLSGYSFFEGPRWHDGRLWLSDFYTHQVIACDLQGRVEKIADVPGQPSGLGWLPDESARETGGDGTAFAILPPEAEGFPMTCFAGPRANLFAGHGKIYENVHNAVAG